MEERRHNNSETIWGRTLLLRFQASRDSDDFFYLSSLSLAVDMIALPEQDTE